MADYIDRDALLNQLADKMREHDVPLNDDYEEGVEPGYDTVFGMIEKAPSADVAPVVHGLWVGEGDGYADGEIVLDVWYCSECNCCIDDGTDDPDILPKYCPECGAKMDGGAA